MPVLSVDSFFLNQILELQLGGCTIKHCICVGKDLYNGALHHTRVLFFSGMKSDGPLARKEGRRFDVRSCLIPHETVAIPEISGAITWRLNYFLKRTCFHFSRKKNICHPWKGSKVYHRERSRTGFRVRHRSSYCLRSFRKVFSADK